MGNIFLPNIQTTKMAFTDLIPFLLGTSGSRFDIKKSVKDFFKDKKPSANLTSQFRRFQEKFQDVDFLLGQIRNPVVQLFMNPQTITINKSVLFDKKQTRGGFVVQFWGHDLETIEVNAATAYFEISKEPLAAFELLKRQVYEGRFHTKQPFRGSPIIAMLFESQVLNGYFTDFSYKISADSPYHMTYSFSFTVTENVTFVTGSNISSTISDIVSVAKAGNFNITRNRSDVDIVPDNLQFGKGWGVQLF